MLSSQFSLTTFISELKKTIYKSTRAKAVRLPISLGTRLLQEEDREPSSPNVFPVNSSASNQGEREEPSLSHSWDETEESVDSENDEVVPKMHTVNVREHREHGKCLLKELSRRFDACIRIVALNLDGCIHMNDTTLRSVCLDGKRAILPHLRNLSVESCMYVTDYSLVKIIKAYNTQMRSLRISKSGATRKTVDAMGTWCTGLKDVAFSNMSTVRDDDLINLANSCKSLKNVNIASCKSITVSAINSLATILQDLELLDISLCGNSNHHSLDLSACQNLCKLRIQGWPRLSDKELIPVLKSSTLLEELSIRNCSSVTVTTIQTIADVCTNLRTLDVVGIHATCTTMLSVLAQSTAVRESLQEFLSSERIILRMSPLLWKLWDGQ